MNQIIYNFQVLQERTKWQSEIFIRGNKLNSAVNELISSVQKKFRCSERKLCKELSITRTLIRNIRGRNGKYPIRASTIGFLLEHLGQDEEEKYLTVINSLVDEISSYQSNQWIRVPRTITPKLAEILGRHAGDGSITKSTYTIKLTCGNEKFLEICYKDFQDIFGIKPRIVKGKGNYWDIKINSLPLTLIFNKIFSISSGKKSEIIREPIIVKESDMECRIAFLRGLIDTDGSIFLNRQKKPVLEIYSNSKQLLLDCQEIIAENNFSSEVYTRTRKGKERYVLRVPVKHAPPLLNLIKPFKYKSIRLAEPETG